MRSGRHVALGVGLLCASAACGGRTTLNAGEEPGLAGAESGSNTAAGASAGAGANASAGATDAPSLAFGGPSCASLPATCGPQQDESCCASSIVPGGKFLRANDHRWPATVSDFRLDRFEVTVGRFRRFAAAYSQSIIANGAGKNPNNPLDTGWDAADWNGRLPGDERELEASLSGAVPNWTHEPTADSEDYPINDVNWFEAEAFCIWDGGRLPTVREWDYTACGGSEQREYPWSDPPRSATIDASYAVYYELGADASLANAARVGSRSPLGDGRYGQADLAGNVSEWVQDYDDDNAGARSKTCDNCALLVVHRITQRDALGGSFLDLTEELSNSLPPDTHGGGLPDWNERTRGFRCARMP